MKTQTFKSTVAIISVIFLTGIISSFTFGQRSGDYEVGHIPDLSGNQVEQIEDLREGHFQTMDSLRTKYRAAISRDKKEQVRLQMAEERLEHRNNVKTLLNQEQKAYYSEHLSGYSKWNCPMWQGEGRMGMRHGNTRGYRGGHCPMR